MKNTTWLGSMMAVIIATAVVTPATSDANPRYVAHATLSGPVAVRVWVQGGDIFPDYNHVSFWLRADRDCYSSLFLVDTAGFIHVLNMGDGWLYGGRAYGYRACDLGLDRLDGRGIAYVFAVGSPVPFDYSYYGDGVRVNGFGYRVVGDPFVACREFYLSALPATCRWDYVGVGFTRFYVREWVRYPAYLCAGGPYHVRVGDNCRDCAAVFASYRSNVAAPCEAIRPVVRYKAGYAPGHLVVRATERVAPEADAGGVVHTRGNTSVATKETLRIKGRDMTRVVSTSRQIARAPQFATNRGAYPHATARGNEATIVAYKGRADVRQSTSVQEKGAHKKVREAE